MSYLAVPGARLFYEQVGTGDPPLVFVHGLACTHDDWRAQVDDFVVVIAWSPAICPATAPPPAIRRGATSTPSGPT